MERVEIIKRLLLWEGEKFEKPLSRWIKKKGWGQIKPEKKEHIKIDKIIANGSGEKT